MNGYNNDMGPQLSDDQFLQWGQAAQPSNSYQDPSAYSNPTAMYSANSTSTATQLTRRPLAQVTPHGRSSESMTGAGWVDQVLVPVQPGDGAWGDDLEELEQKAQVAKHEAQSKRKQIPPFVQKLNRYFHSVTFVGKC